MLTRRQALRGVAALAAGLWVAGARAVARPSVILCMADDLGWGDTAYNGHPHLRTPHLDAMAAAGLRFDRWYSAAPVCSPTRGSCLTGRHPFRYGITHANVGHLPTGEPNLAAILHREGYATGHFGKWHLGTLTRDRVEANRGGRPEHSEHYAPPWERGFDVCFSTESKVPTYNPMVTPPRGAGGVGGREPGAHYETWYWMGAGRPVTHPLGGDDSSLIMSRALDFVADAASAARPFLAVIWFHAPHLPVIASRSRRAVYSGLPRDEQHYYGCVTSLDAQMGRLRRALRDMGIADDTMLWFCSDNGPEGARRQGRTQGSTGPFRGRKRSLHEGGVRVPGILEWPSRVAPGATEAPCVTSDYLPTVLDAMALPSPRQPLDGISLLPLIDRGRAGRETSIGFEHGEQRSWVDDRYKIITTDGGKSYQLYDLAADPGEEHELSAERPETVSTMRAELEAWRSGWAS
ncbi:MAG: sulfatase-like hydrolase/transferase [Armatimonadia bacterium]|nr:sulfatase-like hydrolase/transferase [Armatimonadia bacterium]